MYFLSQTTAHTGQDIFTPPPTFDSGHGSCLEHVWAFSHFAIGLKPDRTSPYTSVNICLMTLIAETALEPDVAGL